MQVAGSRPEGGTPPLGPATESVLRAFYAPGLAELVSREMRDEPDAAAWRAWAELDSPLAAGGAT